MKKDYLKINMDIVRNTIKEKGYYYITADRLFDDKYIGPRLYIVTDDLSITKSNPAFSDVLIMSVEEFEPIALAFNDYIENEDRERHRLKMYNDVEEDKCNLFEESEEKQMLKKVISELNQVQRERLVRYYFYGESYEEIAKRQNVSARAVNYSIRAAERKIKERFCTFTEK